MAELIESKTSVLDDVKIAVVTSRFNKPVTEKLEEGALQRLKELGFRDDQVVFTRVPGALEVPFANQNLLLAGCDGAVALGAVIRGETTHYEYVCESVERALTHLQLDLNKPIASGVLTTENGEQAYARIGGNKGHKGKEAAEVLVEMLNFKRQIQDGLPGK